MVRILIRKLLFLLYLVKNFLFPQTSFSKFLLFHSVRRYIDSKLKKDIVEVLGHRMQVDQHDSLSLGLYGVYEPFETNLIAQHIQRNNVVVDIGANIGYHTLLFARSVGNNGRVFAFEPDPTNYQLLQKNIVLNGYKNVMALQKAVSDKTSTLKLYLSATNMGDHHVYDDGGNRMTLEVDATRLDDFFAEKDQYIDLIKMDIQGAELAALKGMTSILQANNGIKLFVEFSPGLLRKCGTEPKEMIHVLRSLGFSIQHIDESSKSLQEFEYERIAGLFSTKPDSSTNLMCSRNSY